MFHVPFGNAYGDLSRFEFDPDRDKYFLFGTVDDSMFGQEFREVNFCQGGLAGGRAQIDVYVLVVLVPHYVGTGCQQHFVGIVCCFK